MLSLDEIDSERHFAKVRDHGLRAASLAIVVEDLGGTIELQEAQEERKILRLTVPLNPGQQASHGNTAPLNLRGLRSEAENCYMWSHPKEAF